MRSAAVAFAGLLAATTPASALFNFTGQPGIDPLADPGGSGGSGEVQLSPIPREFVAGLAPQGETDSHRHLIG